MAAAIPPAAPAKPKLVNAIEGNCAVCGKVIVLPPSFKTNPRAACCSQCMWQGMRRGEIYQTVVDIPSSKAPKRDEKKDMEV